MHSAGILLAEATRLLLTTPARLADNLAKVKR